MRELSTDRRKSSSGLTSVFCFSKVLIFGHFLTLCVVADAQQAHTSAKAKHSVGQALAADLTWTQAERDVRFGHMDTIFPVRHVRRGGPVRLLTVQRIASLPSKPVSVYMASQHLAGVLVLQDGRIRLERYRLGLTPATRWAGFSLTKAVTGTLVGAALHGGYIHSVDDAVTQYLPALEGSAYAGVTVRQVMTMTSGVRWNESYTSPDADNVRLYTTPVARGKNGTVEYMRLLPRAVQPGSQWQYNTGETDLLGVLLRHATGRTLADQLSTAVWQSAGMDHDATWIATAEGNTGEEFGGSGLSATLRDWGRFGLWVMEGGHGTVDRIWFAQATRVQVQAGGVAYGYGWWPQPDGSFAALGIFGQSMLIDPSRKLIVVTLGDWPNATDADHSAARIAFWQQVKFAVDAEPR